MNLWEFQAAVMMAAQGSVKPREFWSMWLEEAMGLCLGRALLMRRAQREQSGGAAAAGRGFEERPDGTRVYRFGSMAELYNCPALARS